MVSRKNLEPARRKNALAGFCMTISKVVGPDQDVYWDALSWLRLRAKDVCCKDDGLRTVLMTLGVDYAGLAEARHVRLRAALTEEQLGRLAVLVETAVMLEAEDTVDKELADKFGCGVCKNSYLSFERLGSEGPPCTVYGIIPLFCQDFARTVGCRECGTPVPDDVFERARKTGLIALCEKCSAVEGVP